MGRYTTQNKLADVFKHSSSDIHLSNQGLDLLQRMFDYDPDKRISASQALNHPWFKEEPSPKEVNDMPIFDESNENSRKKRR